MKNKKSRLTEILAFGIVIIIVTSALAMDALEPTTDVFPNERTMISLYGETHGYKKCYDTELEEWRRFYDEGCRNLFMELPCYSAGFLNVWMHEDSD